MTVRLGGETAAARFLRELEAEMINHAAVLSPAAAEAVEHSVACFRLRVESWQGFGRRQPTQREGAKRVVVRDCNQHLL